MAEMKMVPIHPDFKMDDMTDKLIKLYQAKGFGVMSSKIGDTVSITFSKDNDGIKKFVGLAKEITANFTISNNGGDAVLMINFTDAEWTGKIIGMVVGWFLCFIPFFIAVYGAVQQSGLPKSITNDVRMLASGGNVPFVT